MPHNQTLKCLKDYLIEHGIVCVSRRSDRHVPQIDKVHEKGKQRGKHNKCLVSSQVFQRETYIDLQLIKLNYLT